MSVAVAEDFFVVAREPGAEHPALPTWASRANNPAELAGDSDLVVSRVDVAAVPGAFQLLNVLSGAECQNLIALTETLGYLPDAAVSLPRSVRHNHNLTWVADPATTDILWSRIAGVMTDAAGIYAGKRAVGLNARFRFYRYQEGDYFKPHTDGAWPGSQVIDGELVANAFTDRWSQSSFIAFLSDDYDGGRTQFYLNQDEPSLPLRSGMAAREVSVATPAGAALCFPHGHHPLHCLHSSEVITRGTKYIIRSDILFEL